MDGDSKRKNNKVSRGNNSVNVGDIFQPIGVRCPVRLCDEINGFLLDYGFNFLPYLSFLIYSVLLIKEAL